MIGSFFFYTLSFTNASDKYYLSCICSDRNKKTFTIKLSIKMIRKSSEPIFIFT